MQKRSNMRNMFRLSVFLKPHLWSIIGAIVLGVLGYLCAMAVPILGAMMIFSLNSTIAPLSMNQAIILIVVCAIARGILKYGEQALNHHLSFSILANIRNQMFTVLRRLAPAKLESKEKGNLLSVITSDIELLEVFFAHTVTPIFIAVIIEIILVIFLMQIHLVFVIMLVSAHLFIGILLPMFISRISKEPATKYREETGKLSNLILENIYGVLEIVQYGGEETQTEKIIATSDQTSVYEEANRQRLGINYSINNTIIWLFNISMVLLGTWFVNYRGLEYYPMLVGIVTFVSSFGPVTTLSNLSSDLSQTFAAANRVLDLMEEEPAVKDIKGHRNIDYQGVELTKVHFGYDKIPVIKDLSLVIGKNSITSIVGKSGSGKSTILKLMMRFWDIDNGKIEYSNKNINKINTTNLRQMISYMTQDTFLFNTSIRENLLIAKQNANDKEIITACKKASIHDFIMSLPEGYNTLVGDLGSRFSSGERQRIGLARAFLHAAPLLLLDEPTSNLDSLNEAIILKSIEAEKDNKAIILISHRESTKRIVDEVYEIEDGKVS